MQRRRRRRRRLRLSLRTAMHAAAPDGRAGAAGVSTFSVLNNLVSTCRNFIFLFDFYICSAPFLSASCTYIFRHHSTQQRVRDAIVNSTASSPGLAWHGMQRQQEIKPEIERWQRQRRVCS
jgi:hypothetical protein